MTAGALLRFLAQHFAQVDHLQIAVEAVGETSVRVRLPVNDAHLRPGGTVAGPSMMQLVDLAMYLLVLAALGAEAGGPAVTSNLSINFLRRPAVRDVLAEGRMIRLGRRMAVGEVTLYSDGEAEPVAHAVVTYAIPAGPARAG